LSRSQRRRRVLLRCPRQKCPAHGRVQRKNVGTVAVFRDLLGHLTPSDRNHAPANEDLRSDPLLTRSSLE
jgi:hypothetical protein